MPETPYFSQERQVSCYAACLRMVLARFSIEKTERDVIELAQLGQPDSIKKSIRNNGLLPPTDANRVLEAFELQHTFLEGISLENLSEELSRGCSLIVGIRPEGLPGGRHAVVVTQILETEVLVLDPNPNIRERTYPMAEFLTVWNALGNKAHVIEPPKSKMDERPED